MSQKYVKFFALFKGRIHHFRPQVLIITFIALNADCFSTAISGTFHSPESKFWRVHNFEGFYLNQMSFKVHKHPGDHPVPLLHLMKAHHGIVHALQYMLSSLCQGLFPCSSYLEISSSAYPKKWYFILCKSAFFSLRQVKCPTKLV